MEILVGTILLIGAFTLGHVTADPETAETQASLEHEQTASSFEVGVIAQGCRYDDDGPVSKDLTLPYIRQRLDDAAASATTTGNCRND